jgi:putative phage-type endonuclease
VIIERRPITSRAEWLDWRRQFLCASEIASAAGLDEYRTPLQVYAEKTGIKLAGAENAAMRRGRLFEGAAIEYLAEEHPDWRIIRPKLFLADREHRLGATPDALLEVPDDPAALINCQIKTVNRHAFERWNGQPPIGYQLQVATENMLLDAARGILAVLVMSAYDAELVLFDVPRHAEAEARIRGLALRFWENIAAGRRPAPDYERDAATIAALFPKGEPGSVLDLGGDNRLAEILPEREFLKDRIDGDKKQVDALDAEIKDKLGDAEAAELPGWRISLKQEQHREYTVPASSRRVLRVKQLKEKEIAA